mmetsp:Transcript_17170/g.39773  ORF Transcript_17170/g.39773 Transcript_17170/m.39773 type:complete len:249 (+) Transcript_17170:20-766(+)
MTVEVCLTKALSRITATNISIMRIPKTDSLNKQVRPFNQTQTTNSTSSWCSSHFAQPRDSPMAILLLNGHNQLGVFHEVGLWLELLQERAFGSRQPAGLAFEMNLVFWMGNLQQTMPSTGNQAALRLMLPKEGPQNDETGPSHPAPCTSSAALRNESLFGPSDDKPLYQHSLFSWLVSRDFLLHFPIFWRMFYHHNHRIVIVIPILRNDSVDGTSRHRNVRVCCVFFFDIIVWILEMAIAWSNVRTPG